MDKPVERSGFIPQIAASGRILAVTMVVCCLLYTLVILGVGQMVTPHRANGLLILNEQGDIIGSELIAQGFSRPGYLWPRPSAVDYNALASGGSNLSPTNPALRLRAKGIIAKMEATGEGKIPANLVTTSGSGLDPDITLDAAGYQAQRISSARGLSIATVTGLFERYAKRPGGALTPEPLVNVLLVNMALDRLGKDNER